MEESMSSARGASGDVIALLLEKRESHLAKAIEYEQAIIDLGGEVPRVAEEATAKVKRVGKKNRAKPGPKKFAKQPRAATVLEYAAGLNGTPVSQSELSRLIYRGTSKRIRTCWTASISKLKMDGKLTANSDGLITGVAG